MALNFLLLYEHVVREYESLLLLKEELARRGYTAEIHQLLARKKLKYFTWKKPQVVVASCLYDDEGLNSHVYNNVGVCNKVVNLHWEQMLSETQEDESWFNFPGAAARCVQTCWGQSTQQRLLAHGLAKENAPVTGALAMDFLRPEFAGYYLDKPALCRQHGLLPGKPLLLYISSFGYACMDDDEVEQLSQMAGTSFSQFALVNRQSMQATLQWFDEFLCENPQQQLVYRRHPSEWDSPALLALQEKHPNFHVIFSGSVQQWIHAADKIFVWMSSAIAEVYFAKKSCSILRPYPIPPQFDPVIYKDCTAMHSCAQFTAAALGTVAAFPINPAVITGYFSAAAAPAYIRMANLLEDVYKKPPRALPFSQGFKPHFNWLKYFALIGIHLLFTLRLNPAALAKIAPRFAAFAGRIYGYVAKAHITKAQKEALQNKIRPYVYTQR